VKGKFFHSPGGRPGVGLNLPVADRGLLFFPGGRPGLLFFPGGRPGAGYFLLRRQEKSNQREGGPSESSPAGIPCAARREKRLKKLARRMRRHVNHASSDSFSPRAPDSDSRRVERVGAPTAAIISINRSFIVSSRTDATRHRVAAALFTTATARRLTRGPKGEQRSDASNGVIVHFEFQSDFYF